METNRHEDVIFRDESTGKCWIKASETDSLIILRRGSRTEAFDKEGFAARFTEVG